MMALRASAWPKDIFASVALAGSLTVPIRLHLDVLADEAYIPIMHLAAQLKT